MSNRDQLLEVAAKLQALKEKKKYNMYDFFFPDSGPLARENYPKHIEFIKAGNNYPERLFSAANQVGKTTTILYEAVTHLRLSYSHWWEGKRFRRSTVGIIGAKTWELLRDGVQAKLLGDFELGTGLIPKEDLVIEKCVRKAGGEGAYSSVVVRNKLGEESKLIFKTYESRQTSWESMTVDFVFFDEEPPMDIYTEGNIRVMQRDGVTAIGFTPDSGLTTTVLHFFKNGEFKRGVADNKFIGMVGWDDVPHLTEESKKAMLQKIPLYLRDAKCKGIPYLGAGRVFQVEFDELTVKPFIFPEYYEKFFGLDPGWNNCAAVWVAEDPDTGIMYVYDEYLTHKEPTAVHAAAFKEKGDWIHGGCDPYSSVAHSPNDGQALLHHYRKAGIEVHIQKKRGIKESSIQVMESLMLQGKLKIFSSCTKILNQLALYHRDEKGKTGKTPDDLVDALRYALIEGRHHRRSYLDHTDSLYSDDVVNNYMDNLGRNKVTGY